MLAVILIIVIIVLWFIPSERSDPSAKKEEHEIKRKVHKWYRDTWYMRHDKDNP